MGRVKKYRAWDTYCKRWRGELGWVIDPDDGMPHWVHEDEVQGIASQLIVTEFTGLTDKNGKEIYESDVIYLAGYGDYLVEWPFLELYDAGAEQDIGAILGNIYEDSNLIDKG